MVRKISKVETTCRDTMWNLKRRVVSSSFFRTNTQLRFHMVWPQVVSTLLNTFYEAIILLDHKMIVVWDQNKWINQNLFNITLSLKGKHTCLVY